MAPPAPSHSARLFGSGRRRLALGLGAATLILSLFSSILLLRGNLMPAPLPRQAFNCPAEGLTGTHGGPGQRLNLNKGKAQASGLLLEDNNIVWDDPAAGAAALGQALPLHVAYSDRQQLRFTGDGGQTMNCIPR